MPDLSHELVLIGAADAPKKICVASSSFTACALSGSLLETRHEAAKSAVSGDLVFGSPVRSVPYRFQYKQCYGQNFCQADKSTGRGVLQSNPNSHGKIMQ